MCIRDRGYLHPRTEEYALSRWRMVTYYVALIVIGVASLTLDAVGAVACLLYTSLG